MRNFVLCTLGRFLTILQDLVPTANGGYASDNRASGWGDKGMVLLFPEFLCFTPTMPTVTSQRSPKVSEKMRLLLLSMRSLMKKRNAEQ